MGCHDQRNIVLYNCALKHPKTIPLSSAARFCPKSEADETGPGDAGSRVKGSPAGLRGSPPRPWGPRSPPLGPRRPCPPGGRCDFVIGRRPLNHAPRFLECAWLANERDPAPWVSSVFLILALSHELNSPTSPSKPLLAARQRHEAHCLSIMKVLDPPLGPIPASQRSYSGPCSFLVSGEGEKPTSTTHTAAPAAQRPAKPPLTNPLMDTRCMFLVLE